MKPSSLVVKVGNFQYLKDDLIGQGSTGKVFLGLNSSNQEKVAIKIIDMKQINNQVTKYLLQCEKQALTSINNPYVLRAYNIYQQQSYCYIVTPYCSGGNLKDYIRKNKRLNQIEAMNFFYKILKGYKSIKQNHFIHRDLKSSNIMLIGKEPIIIDFGYCQKTYGIKPKVFYNVGSPSYMSPQAYYKTTYSQKSDIWALGIILFQMLTGYTIDRGQSINKYFTSLIKFGFKLPPQLSDQCRNIINGTLKINANQRLKTSELLQLVANYFERKNQKTLGHSFSTNDVSLTSSIPNNDQKNLQYKRYSIQNIEQNKNYINQPNGILQQRFIRLNQKQQQNINNKNLNQGNIQKQGIIKHVHQINNNNINQNKHFLNQNTNKAQILQKVNQYSGFPNPLNQVKRQSLYDQKANTNRNSIVIEKNKVLASSCIPQMIKGPQTPMSRNQLWNNRKMAQSIIIDNNNNNIQQRNSDAFAKRRIVQSMHEGIKITDSQVVRNSVQLPQGNRYFQQQLGTPTNNMHNIQHYNKMVPRTQYQNRNAFQPHNPHTDFMSNAHNAFLKKNRPDGQQIVNSQFMRNNNKMINIVLNQNIIPQPPIPNLTNQRRF